MKQISIVISVYNEEEALEQFYQEAKPVFDALSWDYELIFVNDGSTDRSGRILDEFTKRDNKARAVHFSRNFGHEAAMTAGLDYSSGDGIVCMDADLQHPPQCVAKIIEKFEEGYEVISMVRTRNQSAGLVKNITSAAFYRLINTISDVKLEPNASDFFALTANAAAVLKSSYREKVRFLRGYVQNIGFKKTTIAYEAAEYRLSLYDAGIRGQSPCGGREQVQHTQAVPLFGQYDPLLFGSAAEAGHLFRDSGGLPGASRHAGDGVRVGGEGDAERVCDHRGPAVLHVCHAVYCRGNHWRVHFHPVYGAEGQADLYRWQDRKLRERFRQTCV